MNYQEVVENTRNHVGKYSHACGECNGKACKNQIHGPGAKGLGEAKKAYRRVGTSLVNE